MNESTQHKLDRIRPPRVQITYDVETGDAIQKKELPFVVGILADLSGNPEETLPPVKERKFVEIDRDNFDEVLAACAPRLTLRVDNKLSDSDENSQLNVELKFDSMEDFEPGRLLNQIEPLRKLSEARQNLTDLIAKLDGNDALDGLLQEVISNTEGMQSIKSEVGENSEPDSEAEGE